MKECFVHKKTLQVNIQQSVDNCTSWLITPHSDDLNRWQQPTCPIPEPKHRPLSKISASPTMNCTSKITRQQR